MKAVSAVAVLLLAVPALAAEKKCAALKDDGSVIAEFSYPTGKYSECSDKVKTEAAKALCKAGDKKAKFKFRKDENEAPRDSFADCKLAEGGAPAAQPAGEAKPEAKPAGKLDAKCMVACNDKYKPCMAGCAKDVPCINACNKTFTECNKACGKETP